MQRPWHGGAGDVGAAHHVAGEPGQPTGDQSVQPGRGRGSQEFTHAQFLPPDRHGASTGVLVVVTRSWGSPGCTHVAHSFRSNGSNPRSRARPSLDTSMRDPFGTG